MSTRNTGMAWPTESSAPPPGAFFRLALGQSSSQIADTSTLAAPSSFVEFLTGVQIEGPNGPVPLKLFDHQRASAERWDKALHVPGSAEVILKERQEGLSTLCAAFVLYVASFHPWHSGVISEGQRAVNEFMRKLTFIYDNLPPEWKVPYTGVETWKFRHGSVICALPSTKNAGIGYTFKLFVTDEAAAHPWGEENYKQYSPAVAQGLHLIVSAANPNLGGYGFFKDKWDEATGDEPWQYWQEGDTASRPVFIGRHSRPDHDDAFYERERLKMLGDPEGFQALYPVTPADAFKGKSGLVLPEFSEQLHVRPDQPMGWADYAYRFAGIDPGGGDPTAIVPIGSWRDSKVGVVRYHQPGEFYSRKPVTVDEIIAYLSYWHNQAPFSRIWVDIAGGQVLLESLRQRGFPAYPAQKDRDMGIAAYRATLAENRLTLHNSCTEGIKEFAGYRWLNRPDPNSHERFATGTPFDHHADAHDGRRYVLLGAERAWTRLAANEPVIDKRGRRLAPRRIEWVA